MEGQTQDACNSFVFHCHTLSRKNENPLHHSQIQQEKKNEEREDIRFI